LTPTSDQEGGSAWSNARFAAGQYLRESLSSCGGSPRPATHAESREREFKPSLLRILVTWVATVCSEMESSEAI
jgi:hypothetical protein